MASQAQPGPLSFKPDPNPNLSPTPIIPILTMTPNHFELRNVWHQPDVMVSSPPIKMMDYPTPDLDLDTVQLGLGGYGVIGVRLRVSITFLCQPEP